MPVLTLLIAFTIGTVITIPMSKTKYLKEIPRPLVLILIGSLLAGSFSLGDETQWFKTPAWLNPGDVKNTNFFN